MGLATLAKGSTKSACTEDRSQAQSRLPGKFAGAVSFFVVFSCFFLAHPPTGELGALGSGGGLLRVEVERGAGFGNGYWQEPVQESRARASRAATTFLIYQSVFSSGLTGATVGRELLLPAMGETAPQLGREREDEAGRGTAPP